MFRVIGDLNVNQGFISDESHVWAIFKTRNGESGNGNGEWERGMGTGNRERGIFKTGNL